MDFKLKKDKKTLYPRKKFKSPKPVKGLGIILLWAAGRIDDVLEWLWINIDKK